MRPSFAEVPAAAARANSGGAGEGAPAELGPRPGAIRRLGAVPGISGRAPLRARWSKGLGCGRLQVLAKPGVERQGRGSTVAPCFPTPRRLEDRLRSGLWAVQEGLKAWFCGVWHGVWARSRIMSDKVSIIGHRHITTSGADSLANELTKRRRRFTMRQVIRADLDSALRPARRPLGMAAQRRCARRARAKRTAAKAPERQALPPPAPIPAWARASGRAGEGDPLFSAGAELALLDAFLRADPPAAGALRARLALKSAAASAKILRAQRRRSRAARPALRRRRSARAGGEPFVAMARSRRPAAQPRPRPDPRRGGAARPCRWPNATTLAESLRKLAAGQGIRFQRPRRRAALAFSAFPDAPAAEAEILALWVFDMVIAIRLRWPRPLPLIATKILDPSSEVGRGRAAKAGRPSLAERRRGRDRAGRRLRPRPRRRSCPPLQNPDRRRAQTARRNRRPKSSTCCSPRIASRRPKRRARRR